jgi:penicillin-binding protein 1C
MSPGTPLTGRSGQRPGGLAADAPGFYKLSVVDGQGRKATSRVRIKAG